METSERDELVRLILVGNWSVLRKLYDERDALVKDIVARLLTSLNEIGAGEGLRHDVEKFPSGREVALRGAYRGANDTDLVGVGSVYVYVGPEGSSDFEVRIQAKLPRNNIGSRARDASRKFVQDRIGELMASEDGKTAGWSSDDKLDGSQNTDLVYSVIKVDVPAEGQFRRDEYIAKIVEACSDRVALYSTIFEWWRDELKATLVEVEAVREA